MTTTNHELSVRRLPGLEELAEQWRPLALAAGNPFATWEWASTWWRHFGEGKTQRIFGCENEAGELVAIVPLCLERTRATKVLRFLGNFPADVLGPICDPALGFAALAAVYGDLKNRRDWDVLLAERMPSGLGTSIADAIRLRAEPTPELVLETGDWEEFLAGKSANFRGQVRNRERRLLREQRFRYRLADDPARLKKDMETLFALHEKRWSSKGAFGADLRPFHREFADQALAAGFLRFWIAYLDDRPAAAWYGFRFGGADWFYQGGRDPKLGSSSIGFVLMAHTVRDAIESGVGAYKLLLGDEEYKSRFSSRTPEVETFALSRGPLGRAALWAARRTSRL